MRFQSFLAAVVAVAAAAPIAEAQSYAPSTAPSAATAAEPRAPRGVAADYLDHAIVSVYPVDSNLVEILIHDLGRAKSPAPIAIYRVDGKKPTRCGVPLEVFLNGSRVARFRVPAKPAILRVELDPDHEYPDANRTNDVWTAKR